MSNYTDQVAKIKSTIEAFTVSADQGESGRGSKTRSLEARKLSMQLTNELKEFRTISITNDKG